MPKGKTEVPADRGVDRHVGARVRQRRILLGLTQERVAELVGVTTQQAHKYETGVDRISAGRLFALARALGVGVGYLYEGLGDGPAKPTPRRKRMLELARDFAAIADPRRREALCGLARALATAGTGAGGGPPDADG